MYLLKISIAHNKKRIPLLNVLINYVSAKSVSQISSIKGECAFLFSKFLITGLCNSSANSLFQIFSFLTVPLEAFFIKKFIDH